MLAGLHPEFSVHHGILRYTMPLIDELIEPFRPLMDLPVHELHVSQGDDVPLNSAAKNQLIGVTSLDLSYEGISSPVTECLLRMCRSLADVCEGRRRNLALPEPGLPAVAAV